WGLWHDLLKLPSGEFTAKASEVVNHRISVASAGAALDINPLLRTTFEGDIPHVPTDVARIYGKLFTDAYEQWKSAGGDANALGKLPTDVRQLAEVLVGQNAPTQIERDDVRQFLNRSDRNKFMEL